MPITTVKRLNSQIKSCAMKDTKWFMHTNFGIMKFNSRKNVHFQQFANKKQKQNIECFTVTGWTIFLWYLTPIIAIISVLLAAFYMLQEHKNSCTVLSLLSAQGTYVSHFRWVLIEMLKNRAKDRYFTVKSRNMCARGLAFNGLWA